MAISLEDLDNAVSQVDFSQIYRTVSYGLSENNELNIDTPWWISTPAEHPTFVEPPRPGVKPPPNRLQQAIIDCIPTEQSEDCFIDIMHLGPPGNNSSFFNDPTAETTIVKSLDEYLRNFPPRSLTIRFLEGFETPITPNTSTIVRAFLDNPTISRHARFFYGNFSPSFQSDGLKGKIANLICPSIELGLVGKVVQKILDLLSGIVDFLTPGLKQKLVGWVIAFVKTLRNWNHAKMFAINGKHLITGGFNFLDQYLTVPDTGNANTSIFDISMSITGDAAVQAHHFANYFWSYLNHRPCTDESSWLVGREPGTGPELKPMRAPKFEQTVTQYQGNTRAFLAGKSGNWPRHRVGFPAQMFDAIRDFVMNVLVAIAERQSSSDPNTTFKVIQSLSDSDSHFAAVLKVLDVSPATWASKYARNFAISNAQKSVRLSQHTIEDSTLMRDLGYSTLVASINEYVEKNILSDEEKRTPEWDGNLHPYHLYYSLAQALSNISRNPHPGNQVSIILSSKVEMGLFYHRNEFENPRDQVENVNTDEKFRRRLASLLVQMKSSGSIPQDQNIPELLERLVLVDIDDKNRGNIYNHSKLVVVDDSVCYIGSDNTYSAYLEEFGIWIEDRDSIQRFIDEYWTPLWEHLN